jgi:hypothetical protein
MTETDRAVRFAEETLLDSKPYFQKIIKLHYK